MAVFQLGGKNIQVDTYQTSWPVSIFYKRQGVKVQVNPDSHWWCLWLCSSTDDVDQLGCSIVLHSSLVPDTEAKDSCTSCARSRGRGPRDLWLLCSVALRLRGLQRHGPYRGEHLRLQGLPGVFVTEGYLGRVKPCRGPGDAGTSSTTRNAKHLSPAGALAQYAAYDGPLRLVVGQFEEPPQRSRRCLRADHISKPPPIRRPRRPS